MQKDHLPKNYFDLKEKWFALLREKRNDEAEEFYFNSIMPAIIPLIKEKASPLPRYDGMISLLGFTPETVVLTYAVLRPKTLVVLHTPETEKNLDTVLRRSGIKAIDFFHESFQHDATQIDDIYIALKRAINRFNYGSKIVLELTGGKKTMGAQLAIAAGVLEQGKKLKIDVCYIDYDKYLPEFRKPEPETNRLLLIENPLAAPYKLFGSIDTDKLSIKEVIANPIFKNRDFLIRPDMAFVLMPFMEIWSNKLWKKLIIPVCKKVGLNPVRADDLFGQEIMEDIWKGIFEAKIIIADISKRNANVFYELGIAHTLGKEFILLTQSTEDIPFDLNKYRFIIYEDNTEGLLKLKIQLEAQLRKII